MTVNRRLELLLVTGLLLLAALLRLSDLRTLPPAFSDGELTYIRITEAVSGGDVAVFYPDAEQGGRAGLYGVLNSVLTAFVGDGVLGYRLLPALGSLLTLALGYALARRLFGPPVALLTLAAMTVNLRLILLARSGLAESLVPAYVLLALLGLSAAFNLRREIRFHAPTTTAFALLALLFGASGYLHYSGLVLGPVGALFFAHLVITRQPISRRVWSAWVFVLALATVIGAPYLLSSLRIPSESEAYRLWTARPANLRALIDGALHAVGGVVWQGDPRMTHAVREQALIGPLLGLLLIVGLAEALRRWREPRYALLVLTLGAGLLTDAWVGADTTFSANLVALPAVLILPGVGVAVIVRGLHARGAREVWGWAAAIAVVVIAGNLVAIRERFFDDWRHDPAVASAYHARWGYVAAYLDRTPDDLPVSLCAARLDEPGRSGLTLRQTLDALRHREDQPLRHADCRGGMVLIDAGAPMRFVFMDVEDRALMPPELAEWLVDGVPIAVPGLPEGSVLRLDLAQRLADAGGKWGALALAYYMPDEQGLGSQVPIPAPFDEHLTFAGYDPRVLNGPRVAGGPPIVLVTYWRVDGELPDDLGIFAHLLAYPERNPAGGPAIPLLEPWAEANGLDVVASELENRDFFVQVSYLWLSEALRPADYALTVGAYTDQVAVLEDHLDLLDPALDYRAHGDRLLLGNITVIAPETH